MPPYRILWSGPGNAAWSTRNGNDAQYDTLPRVLDAALSCYQTGNAGAAQGLSSGHHGTENIKKFVNFPAPASNPTTHWQTESDGAVSSRRELQPTSRSHEGTGFSSHLAGNMDSRRSSSLSGFGGSRKGQLEMEMARNTNCHECEIPRCPLAKPTIQKPRRVLPWSRRGNQSEQKSGVPPNQPTCNPRPTDKPNQAGLSALLVRYSPIVALRRD